MKKKYENEVNIYITPFELFILIIFFIAFVLSVLYCEGII